MFFPYDIIAYLDTSLENTWTKVKKQAPFPTPGGLLELPYSVEIRISLVWGGSLFPKLYSFRSGRQRLQKYNLMRDERFHDLFVHTFISAAMRNKRYSLKLCITLNFSICQCLYNSSASLVQRFLQNFVFVSLIGLNFQIVSERHGSFSFVYSNVNLQWKE